MMLRTFERSYHEGSNPCIQRLATTASNIYRRVDVILLESTKQQRISTPLNNFLISEERHLRLSEDHRRKRTGRTRK